MDKDLLKFDARKIKDWEDLKIAYEGVQKYINGLLKVYEHSGDDKIRKLASLLKKVQGEIGYHYYWMGSAVASIHPKALVSYATALAKSVAKAKLLIDQIKDIVLSYKEIAEGKRPMGINEIIKSIINEEKDHDCGGDVDCKECIKTEDLEIDIQEDEADEKDAERKQMAGDDELGEDLEKGEKTVKTKISEDVATDKPLELPSTTGGVKSVGMNGVVAPKTCDIVSDVDMRSGQPVRSFRLLLQWSNGNMKVLPDFSTEGAASVEALADYVTESDQETRDLVMAVILRHTIRG